MSARTVLSGLVATLLGVSLAGLAYWELLRVPESNVIALLLSAALVLAGTLVVGITVGTVVALAGGAPARSALARGVRALPGFLIGALVLLALVWLTGSIGEQWTLHRGEIDALFLRYAGTDRTAGVRSSIALAYPVGGRNAFDGRVVDAVARAGYQFAFTYEHGVNGLAAGERFELKRLHVERYTSRHLFAATLEMPEVFAR